MKESLISVASEGGGAHAIDVMAGVAEPLARAVRRAVPFLGRRQVAVRLAAPKLMSTQKVGRDLQGPVYVSHLVAEPGGARARICFDAPAVAFLLDGTLCGDGSKQSKLSLTGLTPAQVAFIEQMSETLVNALSKALSCEIGMVLNTMPVVRGGQTASGSTVALSFSFVEEKKKEEDEEEFLFEEEDEEGEEEEQEELTSLGTIVLAISKSALMSARLSQAKPSDEVDDRVIATMGEVQVDVVAELGRIVMSVAQLAGLRVGHTLRVPVAVNGSVEVLVEDVALFKGRPTTSGSQLAIKLIDPEHAATLSMAPGPGGGVGTEPMAPEAHRVDMRA